MDEIRRNALYPIAIGARMEMLAASIDMEYDRLSGGRGTAVERAVFEERLGIYEQMMTGSVQAGGRAGPDDFFEHAMDDRVARVRADLAAYGAGRAVAYGQRVSVPAQSAAFRAGTVVGIFAVHPRSTHDDPWPDQQPSVMVEADNGSVDVWRLDQRESGEGAEEARR